MISFKPFLLAVLALIVFATTAEAEKPNAQRVSAIELNNEGARALSKKDFKTAIAKFEQSLAADPSYEVPQKNLSILFNNCATTIADTKPDEALFFLERGVYADPVNETTLDNLRNVFLRLKKNPDSAQDHIALGQARALDETHDDTIATQCAVVEYCLAAKCAAKDEKLLTAILPAIRTLCKSEGVQDSVRSELLAMSGETRESIFDETNPMPTDALNIVETWGLGGGIFFLLISWIPAVNKKQIYTWIMIALSLPLAALGVWLLTSLGEATLACDPRMINWTVTIWVTVPGIILTTALYFMPSAIAIRERNRIPIVITVNLLALVLAPLIYPVALTLACMSPIGKESKNKSESKTASPSDFTDGAKKRSQDFGERETPDA